MLPVIKLGGAEVTRLIVGGNPFSGNSHVSEEMDSEMMDYFSTENIKKTLKDCAANGINTMQMRADSHIMRIVRELRSEGVPLRWIAQTAPEFGSYENNVRSMLKYDPLAIYHHGSMTDIFFKEKNYDELIRRLKVIRETGRTVGLCTHMPEVIYHAEENNWDVDFYMACVYNLSAAPRESGSLTGKANVNERFEDEDKPLMYAAIKSVSKPCLAFKILGSTRNCGSPATVEAAYRECFENIKSTDAVIVGMFPKYSDQPAENCSIVKKILSGK